MSGGQRLGWDLCFRCGYAFDTVSTLLPGTPRPEEGDLSLCASCGELLAFDAHLRTRPSTCDDTAGLGPDQIRNIALAQSFIRQRGALPTRRAPT
jgi:hypothetical protein